MMRQAFCKTIEDIFAPKRPVATKKKKNDDGSSGGGSGDDDDDDEGAVHELTEGEIREVVDAFLRQLDIISKKGIPTEEELERQKEKYELSAKAAMAAGVLPTSVEEALTEERKRYGVRADGDDGSDGDDDEEDEDHESEEEEATSRRSTRRSTRGSSSSSKNKGEEEKEKEKEKKKGGGSGGGKGKKGKRSKGGASSSSRKKKAGAEEEGETEDKEKEGEVEMYLLVKGLFCDKVDNKSFQVKPGEPLFVIKMRVAARFVLERRPLYFGVIAADGAPSPLRDTTGGF